MNLNWILGWIVQFLPLEITKLFQAKLASFPGSSRARNREDPGNEVEVKHPSNHTFSS